MDIRTITDLLGKRGERKITDAFEKVEIPSLWEKCVREPAFSIQIP